MASPVHHAVDASILEPFAYISETPGKDVRGALIDAFNVWLKIPPEKVTQIKSIISPAPQRCFTGRRHRGRVAIETGQARGPRHLRRALHAQRGELRVLVASEECHRLGSPEALSVFVEELLNLHRGQGQDIVWRDTQKVPSEKEYYSMVLDKTGGLFRLAVSCSASLNMMCRAMASHETFRAGRPHGRVPRDKSESIN